MSMTETAAPILKGIPLPDRNTMTAIAASLMRVSDGPNFQSLMITSCRAGEGKTVTALNMSKALVEEAGKRVLLIDGNHEAPALHEYFELDTGAGLNDLIHNRAVPEEIMARTMRSEFDQLVVVPYGPPGPRNLDFFKAGRFKKIISELGKGFDTVLFDGPSIFGKQDPGNITSAFDGIVMVIECEKTPWEVVQSGKQRIEEMGANVIGAVMNKRKYYIPRGLYA